MKGFELYISKWEIGRNKNISLLVHKNVSIRIDPMGNHYSDNVWSCWNKEGFFKNKSDYTIELDQNMKGYSRVYNGDKELVLEVSLYRSFQYYTITKDGIERLPKIEDNEEKVEIFRDSLISNGFSEVDKLRFKSEDNDSREI